MAAARLLIVFALSLLLFSQETKGQGTGSVRLYKNSNTNPSNTRGIVEVFYNGKWGTVCNTGNDNNIPDVVCHQLGYTGGSFDNTNFETDPLPGVVNSVSCSTSDYLVLLQCKFDAPNSTSPCESDQVKIACDTSRLPAYTGMVRLQDGSYIGQGRAEVYCNGQWGAICADSSFNTNAAITLCRQLGYNFATYTTEVYTGKIWYENLRCSTSNSESCLSDCDGASCPSSYATCSNHNVVNVTCSHTGTNYDGSQRDTCKPPGPNKWKSTGAKIGYSFGGLGLLAFIVIISVVFGCLFCCKKCRSKIRNKLCNKEGYNDLN